MIVYIVEALSSQDYENTSWIVKVFDSEHKATTWVDIKLKEDDTKEEPENYCYIITEKELE